MYIDTDQRMYTQNMHSRPTLYQVTCVYLKVSECEVMLADSFESTCVFVKFRLLVVGAGELQKCGTFE